MILKTVLLNLSILLLSISAFCECKKIHTNFTEEFVNLAFVSDYVYIGGKHSLIQLNSSLGIVNIKPTNRSNWLLTPYETKNEGTILIACGYKEEYKSSCTGYRNNLSIIVEYEGQDIPMGKTPHARYTTTTIGSDNIITVASSDCTQPGIYAQGCFAITNYWKDIKHYDIGSYSVEYLSKNAKSKFSFDFRAVVGNGNYTYFLFMFNHTVSKLGKICKDTNTFNVNLNAYEDVPIFCSHNGVNFTTAQDLIFWNDDLLVVFNNSTASVICKFTKLYDNFKISRIERLKCSYRQLKNKYFKNPSLDVCYNETIGKCQPSTVVSIALRILLY